MKDSPHRRILVVEDEMHIAEGLRLNLTLQGYEVRIAGDGVSALSHYKTDRPDLIVLDIMLPGIDGLSVLRNIRLEDPRIPVLILSAKGDADDKVKGLSYGGDDYLSKPFHLEEFLARVDRLLTRSGLNKPGIDSAGVPEGIYTFGSNIIDFAAASATGKTGKILLTEQEIKLLKLFIAHRGRPLSREKLLEIGWGYTGAVTTRTVDNFMVRLRKYFEENPKNPIYFKSLRSIGYVFDPDGESP